jgi:hypothetical protein
MAGRTKRVMRGGATARKKHRTSARARKKLRATAGLKRSRTQVSQKRRCPKISRTRLRMLRDDLDGTRNVVTDTFDNFWIISERDIRDTLAKTQKKIGRAVDMLKRAA